MKVRRYISLYRSIFSLGKLNDFIQFTSICVIYLRAFPKNIWKKNIMLSLREPGGLAGITPTNYRKLKTEKLTIYSVLLFLNLNYQLKIKN